MFYVYLLRSLNSGKSYIGFTSKNPKDRLTEHNSGTNQFTSSNGPWDLKYFEQFDCEKCARNRELFLKSGVGEKLVKLIIDNY